MKLSHITLLLCLFIIIAGALVVVSVKKNSEGSGSSLYTEFAQCLGNNGAKFHGAWWCSACRQQKSLFASAQKDLPYIECSNPDRTQTQECTDLGIKSYPTWKFTDGTEVKGVMSLEDLAEKTSCELPLDSTTTIEPEAEVVEE